MPSRSSAFPCAHAALGMRRPRPSAGEAPLLVWGPRCAFRNCQHLQEPGCAVRPGWARHAWYAELHAEVRAGEDLLRHRAGSKKRCAR